MNVNTDRIIINGNEYEVNKCTGELVPLCYWLSHDSCILENICCDGKGRCKCTYETGDDFTPPTELA